MLAPALHQLIDCFHSLTNCVGLHFLDRLFPLLLLAVVVIVTALAARRRQTSRG